MPRQKGNDAMQTVNLVRGETKLAPKQQEAIEAWLRLGDIEDAAREIGVTTKKLCGWMKNRVCSWPHTGPRYVPNNRAVATLPRYGSRYGSAEMCCLVLSVVYDRDSVRIWLAPTNTVAEPLRREKKEMTRCKP
jgi:hypothetical protein